jgi:hypothetical protein
MPTENTIPAYGFGTTGTVRNLIPPLGYGTSPVAPPAVSQVIIID